MKKRMITLAMTLVMALSLAVPAGAANVVNDDQELTEENITHVESIFCQDRIVEVQDSDGNNVTEAFIEENMGNYESGAYGNILDALADESLVIVEPFEETGIVPQYMLVKRANSHVCTVYFKSYLTGQQSKEYISFHLSAEYTVDSLKNTISTASNPYVVIDGKSGTSLQKSVTLDKKSYQINSGGKSVTYKGTCVAKLATPLSPPVPVAEVVNVSFMGYA